MTLGLGGLEAEEGRCLAGGQRWASEGHMAHEAVRCVCKNAVNLQVGREFGQTGVVVNNVVLPHSQPLDVSAKARRSA